ncbi:GntR family transcriptional regulator [Allostreptomyces psammosilenae]|uniref:GntR family transcriptional regulator n=1 Tax=Allostreptomyces psammosilenae TaxID=1892865 RepID=A0A853A842_9ACTN|nr:GntR family transcriptional regulator [Allostreptomyces psammosilenae]NYI06821.1 GntR family transcriptional regulator [Allostreptomyces psammosilenae]
MTDRPGYQRIADALRDRIASGDLPAGARLAPLPQMAAEHGVSETMIRQALGVLRAEGLIESRGRAGTTVRQRPPVRRLAASRYRDAGATPATAFTVDQGAEWSEYRLDKRFERVEADADLAALFGEQPGLQLLARHFVFWDRGAPEQMSVSYVRWSDVVGTPVADPINEPWPGGTKAQMRTLGIDVVCVTESVSARMPSRLEAETLRIPAATPVMTITRRMLTAEKRVVEVAHPIVRPADRVVLDYEIEL